jgi:hypothetical protein
MRFNQRMRVYSHPVRFVTACAVLTMEGRASARLQEPKSAKRLEKCQQIVQGCRIVS